MLGIGIDQLSDASEVKNLL